MGEGSLVEYASVVDAVAELIGPDGKFHHCKLNLVRQYESD